MNNKTIVSFDCIDRKYSSDKEGNPIDKETFKIEITDNKRGIRIAKAVHADKNDLKEVVTGINNLLNDVISSLLTKKDKLIDCEWNDPVMTINKHLAELNKK